MSDDRTDGVSLWLASLVTGMGGGLLIVSIFLPLDHPQTLFRVASEHTETALRIAGIRSETEDLEITPPALFGSDDDSEDDGDEDAPPDDNDLIEEEPEDETDGTDSDRTHVDLLYRASLVPALLAPAFAGLSLLILAAFGRRRSVRFICSLSQALLFVVLASALWCLYFLNDEVSRNATFLTGALVLSAIAVLLVALCRTSLLKHDGRGRGLYTVSLGFFLLVGVVAALSQWQNDQWHVMDAVVMALGSGMGLFGIWRLGPGHG